MHARLVVSGRGSHETSLGCLEPRWPEGRRRPHEEAGKGPEAEACAAKLRHCCYCYCCCSCMRHIIQIVRGREARLPPGDQTIHEKRTPFQGSFFCLLAYLKTNRRINNRVRFLDTVSGPRCRVEFTFLKTRRQHWWLGWVNACAQA